MVLRFHCELKSVIPGAKAQDRGENMIDAEEHVYDDDPQNGPSDVQTLLPGVNYFFLGNGLIQAAVQLDLSGEGTPLGLLFMDPEKLCKKRESLSFEARQGLQHTRVLITVRGIQYVPGTGDLKADWALHCGVPAVFATWSAGEIEVQERFFCPNSSKPLLTRALMFSNRLDQPLSLQIESELVQGGDSHSMVIESKAEARLYLLYELTEDRQGISVRFSDSDGLHPGMPSFWNRTARATFGSERLDRYFDACRFQLPAVVSAQGRVDASIWQYNREWVRDHSWIAVGLLLSGQHAPARTLLERLLREFVTADGDPIDSSQHRHPDEVELDQNGELLYALDQYTRWTGDRSLIKTHWRRVESLAEFPLRDIFRHAPSGLLINKREYWERHSIHGIQPGMELAYQMFVTLGLESASGLAQLNKRSVQSRKWAAEAIRLRNAAFEESPYAFVSSGRLVKRKNPDGTCCEKIAALAGAGLPDGSPLAVPGDHWLNPDTSTALPVAFEIIPGGSELAAATLDGLEELWNQDWSGGGYGRYHCSSEPDAWGPWPFPSLFVARACVEAGRYERTQQILSWLETLPGGISGAWFEFYGQSHSPPFAQIGITPWTWAEMLLLLVHHVLGIRPGHGHLRLRPRLLPGMDQVRISIPLKKNRLELSIHGCPQGPASFKANAPILRAGANEVDLAYTDRDIRIEASVPFPSVSDRD